MSSSIGYQQSVLKIGPQAPFLIDKEFVTYEAYFGGFLFFFWLAYWVADVQSLLFQITLRLVWDTCYSSRDMLPLCPLFPLAFAYCMTSSASPEPVILMLWRWSTGPWQDHDLDELCFFWFFWLKIGTLILFAITICKNTTSTTQALLLFAWGVWFAFSYSFKFYPLLFFF